MCICPKIDRAYLVSRQAQAMPLLNICACLMKSGKCEAGIVKYGYANSNITSVKSAPYIPMCDYRIIFE